MLWRPHEFPLRGNLRFPPLLKSETHVWRISRMLNDFFLQRLFSLLTPEEKARAERFSQAEDRIRMIISRGGCRLLMAGYLGVDPDRLEYALGPHGKPELAPNLGIKIEFNTSHSGDWVLIAFTLDRVLGVDVEKWRMRDHLSLAKMCFTGDELNAWERVPPSHREKAFYDQWCLKEAYVKGLGRGLSQPLRDFGFSMKRLPLVARLPDGREPTGTERWAGAIIEMDAGYSAAVVTKHHIGEMRYMVLVG